MRPPTGMVAPGLNTRTGETCFPCGPRLHSIEVNDIAEMVVNMLNTAHKCKDEVLDMKRALQIDKNTTIEEMS